MPRPTNCEWCERHGIVRPMTVITAWGDFHLCEGHAKVARFNRDTWNYDGSEEMKEHLRDQMIEYKQWFRDNPAEGTIKEKE